MTAQLSSNHPWRPLILPHSGKMARRCIAYRGSYKVHEDEFFHDIQQLARRIQKSGCRRVCLVETEPYSLLVGLMALLACRVTAILPPHSSPALLQQLANEYDFLLSHDPNLPGRDLPDYGPSVDKRDECIPQPVQGQVLFYTSGSTGAPKPIERQWSQLVEEITILQNTWPERSTARDSFSMVPPGHLYGLTFAVLWPFLSGSPFQTHIFPYWEDLLQHNLADAVIISSPAQLACMEALPAWQDSIKPRQLFVAGAPLPEHAISHCQHVLGILPNEIYGSTETGAIATRSWQNQNTIPSWHPLPGLSVRSGPEEQLQLLSPFISPHWITTDDQVSFHADGSFTLLGRRDQIIKINAQRVSLQEVEQALQQLPDIVQAKPVVLSGKNGLILGAVVVPSSNGWASLHTNGTFRFSRQLRQQMLAYLPAAAQPKRWRFVRTMPNNALGKTTAQALQALFLNAQDIIHE
ncbi:AMP-binding protein [Candidatus Magnetaquicoccus inordinatus]|uniref:AMP-binding protein n=1 Tax=Candidatus Magnetaquicoccus inordinatus TaxID=2496818 RepID=UPI00102CCD16|nr:AMP-binding protein [Candidatus Magnetaquicoccus inordinatus]